MTDELVISSTGGISLSDLLALTKPTPPDEIKWRAGSRMHQGDCGKPCNLPHKQLAYVDARYVMQRLDDEIGPAYWTRKHLIGSDGRVACGIGILVEGVGWVEKWDGAGETDIEGEKGSFSDSFKRAAVGWGIARDLYSLGQSAPNAAPSAPSGQAPQYAAPAPTPPQGEGCPDHGTASLRASKPEYGGGFFCSAKGGAHPNGRGYCSWSIKANAA